MRKKIEYKTIKISKKLYERLKQERDNFEKTIGGGKWSFGDTIREFIILARAGK